MTRWTILFILLVTLATAGCSVAGSAISGVADIATTTVGAAADVVTSPVR